MSDINEMCLRCVRDCKQLAKARIVACPLFREATERQEGADSARRHDDESETASRPGR